MSLNSVWYRCWVGVTVKGWDEAFQTVLVSRKLRTVPLVTLKYLKLRIF